MVTRKQGGIALQLIQCRLSAPPGARCQLGVQRLLQQCPAKEDKASINRLTFGRDMLADMCPPGSFPGLTLLPLQTAK